MVSEVAEVDLKRWRGAHGSIISVMVVHPLVESTDVADDDVIVDVSHHVFEHLDGPLLGVLIFDDVGSSSLPEGKLDNLSWSRVGNNEDLGSVSVGLALESGDTDV